MIDADPNDLVTLRQVRTEFEANTLVAVLADEGIEAFAFGNVRRSLPLDARYTSVPLQVRRHDRVRALEVLAQNEQAAREVDWDALEVGERTEAHPETHRPRRMPWPAAIGFIVAVLSVLVILVVFVVELIRSTLAAAS